MPDTFQILITCEHGGNKVPQKYRYLFANNQSVLETHRGYDPGALEMAKTIVKHLQCPFVYESISRLLVEQNRSCHHKEIFSEYSLQLSESQRSDLIKHIYDPFHTKVDSYIATAVKKNKFVAHFSIHSFTPVLNGETRNADIGLLYDPSRKEELTIVDSIKSQLLEMIGGIKIRKNYPYRGNSDGQTTTLRKRYTEKQYSGIEIEINQKHFFKRSEIWKTLKTCLPLCIRQTVYKCNRDVIVKVGNRHR